jgi:hypothetical protein
MKKLEEQIFILDIFGSIILIMAFLITVLRRRGNNAFNMSSLNLQSENVNLQENSHFYNSRNVMEKECFMLNFSLEKEKFTTRDAQDLAGCLFKGDNNLLHTHKNKNNMIGKKRNRNDEFYYQGIDYR